MSRPDPMTGPAADQATDPAGRAIRTLLTAASEDQPPTIDLLGKVRHRARRRRALVPSLAALSAVGVLAAVAVATSTVTAPPPASAQERVVAAVTQTAQDGYRIRAAMSGSKGGRNETSVSQGVFDPVGRAVRMVVVTPDKGHVTIHHQDGRVYVQLPAGVAGRQPGVPRGARWFLRTTRDPNDAGISDLADFGRRALLSPQEALELAQSATDVREAGPVSGDGWTGTRFAFTLTDRQWRVSGSVDVDGDGRVRRLEFVSSSTDTAHGVAGTLHWVLTFWDFGIRERVMLPPGSQVYRDPAPDPKELKELAERLRNQRD
jgi:hypothetical protein